MIIMFIMIMSIIVITTIINNMIIIILRAGAPACRPGQTSCSCSGLKIPPPFRRADMCVCFLCHYICQYVCMQYLQYGFIHKCVYMLYIYIYIYYTRIYIYIYIQIFVVQAEEKQIAKWLPKILS